MKKKLTIAGALFGALFGLGIMAVAYSKSPGTPGFYELIVQIAVVALLAVPLAVVGFIVGWIIDLLSASKKMPNKP